MERAGWNLRFLPRIIFYDFLYQRNSYYKYDDKIGILELFSKNRLFFLAFSPENALWVVPHSARFPPVANASNISWRN